jgi:Na+-transporting NADH:ubiquinone oxidoreductase subunit NqrC
MLNIYRVISLSLLMSLFFAAPLLCVHPVSIQQQKRYALATKRQQAQRATVAWQRTSHTPTDRLADSLRQAQFVQAQGEEWNEDEREDWNGVEVTAGTHGMRTISHSSIY